MVVLVVSRAPADGDSDAAGLKHFRPRLAFAAGETRWAAHQTDVSIDETRQAGHMWEETDRPCVACTVEDGGGLAAMSGRGSGVAVVGNKEVDRCLGCLGAALGCGARGVRYMKTETVQALAIQPEYIWVWASLNVSCSINSRRGRLRVLEPWSRRYARRCSR